MDFDACYDCSEKIYFKFHFPKIEKWRPSKLKIIIVNLISSRQNEKNLLIIIFDVPFLYKLVLQRILLILSGRGITSIGSD